MQTPGDDETGPSCTVSQAARRQRASESADARERRLERQRARRRHLLASETAEERQSRLSQRRVRDRARRAARSSPTSEARHEQMRSVQQRRRATEAPGDTAARLQDVRVRQQERIDSETPEETAARLQDLRARQQERIDSETPEETAARLQDVRVRQQERIDSETPKETAARLQDVRVRQQERIDSETPEETAARLQDLRARQQERIDSETPEETAARLQDLRAHQQERIDSETPEETAARRQRDREAHSHRPPLASAQPLLHQPAVQSRMRKFHSQLASLEVSTCTTCLERFPGMTTRHTSAGTVCIRCYRDTHTLKAYSRENNMHPGPVPMELLVGIDGHCVCAVLIVTHLISFLIFSYAGADPSGRNAYLSSDAHYVSVQTAPWTVWVQWACCQPPPGCGLLLSQSAPPSLSTGRHCRQEGGGQPEPSGLPCQTCSGAQSSPVAAHTQPVLPLCGCDHRHHCSGPAPTGWEHLPACVCH